MTRAKEKQADDLTGISQTAYNMCWACRHADQNYARSGTDGNHKHVQRAWAELIVAKNRQLSTGIAQVTWMPEHMRFEARSTREEQT